MFSQKLLFKIIIITSLQPCAQTSKILYARLSSSYIWVTSGLSFIKDRIKFSDLAQPLCFACGYLMWDVISFGSWVVIIYK